jgi:hypothetical protein
MRNRKEKSSTLSYSMFLLFALIRMKARSEEIEQIVCGFGFGVWGFWRVWVWVWVWEAGVLSPA